MSERILSVLVEDKPGVLARISSTISRRGFNINFKTCELIKERTGNKI